MFRCHPLFLRDSGRIHEGVDARAERLEQTLSLWRAICQSGLFGQLIHQRTEVLVWRQGWQLEMPRVQLSGSGDTVSLSLGDIIVVALVVILCWAEVKSIDTAGRP